ncbi:SDR family NAD(P)-dependent oxidoreductase [Pseudonocardia spinosispora]|uniref:SDR family NAD(P)-dependent oxidoreductase n=1 Tax=Pseudonocardia spinosispora TaxID=103441 RepID=UPI00041E07F6|nr:SDR family oxidoreductase [Pseudonocardia spinosispora]
MSDLAGTVTIVTGGTSGLGAETAALFARRGVTVVIAGRRQEEGERTAARLGPSVHFHRTDVARETQVRELVESTHDRFGRLDCLVNNAGGGGTPGPVGELDLDAFAETLAVHVLGMAAGIKYAAAPMLAQGSGSIVNVASVGGSVAGWTPMDYSVAKAGVLQLTRCAAVELGERGIRVNSVSPGPIPTGIQLKLPGTDPALAERAAASLVPLFAAGLRPWQAIPRVGDPADVAATIAWLGGPDSSFVTGQDIAVDGGIRAGRPASVSVADYAALTTLTDQLAEHVVGSERA